jgi:hypothetical protein
MDTVYIETSVVSHATAWPSKNPAIAVLQAHAKQWLETEAPKFRLVTSQFVIDEASRGDPDAAKRRLDALHVASAVLAGVDYLLTQNCRHIANATELPRLYRLLEEMRLPRILVCTPIQFLGDPENDI